MNFVINHGLLQGYLYLIYLYMSVIIRLDRIIQGFAWKRETISVVDSPIKSWNDKLLDTSWVVVRRFNNNYF